MFLNGRVRHPWSEYRYGRISPRKVRHKKEYHSKLINTGGAPSKRCIADEHSQEVDGDRSHQKGDWKMDKERMNIWRLVGEPHSTEWHQGATRQAETCGHPLNSSMAH